MSDDVILGLDDYKYYKDNLWQWGQTQIEDDLKIDDELKNEDNI